MKQNWRMRYEDRANYGSHFILHTKILLKWESFEFFAEAKNLLDTSYEEIDSIPAPGRWALIGLCLSMFSPK